MNRLQSTSIVGCTYLILVVTKSGNNVQILTVFPVNCYCVVNYELFLSCMETLYPQPVLPGAQISQQFFGLFKLKQQMSGFFSRSPNISFSDNKCPNLSQDSSSSNRICPKMLKKFQIFTFFSHFVSFEWSKQKKWEILIV